MQKGMVDDSLYRSGSLLVRMLGNKSLDIAIFHGGKILFKDIEPYHPAVMYIIVSQIFSHKVNSGIEHYDMP